MKPVTILDYALFRLDATRSRCELWIAAGNATEKLATGLFKPFLWHLTVAQQQMAGGATDVRLCPSSFSHETAGNDFQWFSKATIERFVRFVSTPEVLERAFIVESKLKHVEEISTIITTESLCHSGDSARNSATSSTTGLSDFLTFHQLPLKASSKPVKEALFQGFGNDENIARRLLLKILKSEWHMLRKTQDVIMHQAASAGFDIDHIPNLLVFADCFEAPQLKDSCLKFMALLEKRQSNLFCLNEPDFEVAICSAMNMIAADSPGYLENAEDNWFRSKFYKSILNYNNTQIHMSHKDRVAESAENLVSNVPSFSQFASAIAACKAAGLFHEPVALVGLDSRVFNSDELESFWDSMTAHAQNLLIDPYEEGLLTVSRHDCHATLEEHKSQSVSLCGGDLNISRLMEGAAKYGIAEQVPGGFHKDPSTEQMDRRASILNLTSNRFVFQKQRVEKSYFENSCNREEDQLQATNGFQSEETSYEVECRTGEVYEDILRGSGSNPATGMIKDIGCNESESRLSHIEAVSYSSEGRQQNLTVPLKEKFEAWKSLSWLPELEKMDESNAQPCEASEVRQFVEISTTMNLEHVAENRAESIYLQTEMQSLLSEGYNQSRQRSQEDLSMLCTGTGSADMEMLYSLDMVTDASSFEKELLSISNSSYPADQKGRLYEQYREHRDAKLRKESALRKAERRAKLEALQEALEKRKAEMASRKICLMEKHLLTEQEIQGNNQAGKPDCSSQKIEDMMDTLEKSSTLDQQTSNSGSISARNAVPMSHKSLITSTTQSSLHTFVSSSQKPVTTFSISKHHSSELTKTPKTAEKNLRKPVPASPKGPKNETTKPFSGGDGQLSQQEKGRFLSARKSKACINASCHKHAYKGFPSKSNNLASSPLEHTRKHRIFPTRKRISAVSDSNGMQTPEHNSAPVTMKVMQSRLHPQSKAYKVSLTLTVSKNSKPFLRKGRGIGPGAGPGILKSKAPLASDSNRIHNEELLQTPESHYAETITTFRVEKQTEQSAEELNQIESFKSNSEAVCNLFPAGEKETPSANLSPERANVDNQHFFLQCANILQDPQDDISAITSSSGNLMHTADLQFKCSTSNAASNALFSSSSPNSTLQKHAVEDDDCATPAVISNISQFKPECIDEMVISDSGTSFAHTLCNITQLCYKISAKSATSDAAQLCKNSGIQNTAFAPKRAQQFKRLLKGLKSFLKFNRKNQKSSKEI